MSRRLQIAALMVASLSLAGCHPAPKATPTTSATIEDSSGVRVMILDPTGPSRAAQGAAAKANDAVRGQQDSIDELGAP